MALLTKIAWRVQSQLEALWIKVLKSLYFTRIDFVQAKKRSRVSWYCTSIWEGLQILKKRTIWQIGDGNMVNIWEDSWVPRCVDNKLHKLVSSYVSFEGKVSELLFMSNLGGSLSIFNIIKAIRNCVLHVFEDGKKRLPM